MSNYKYTKIKQLRLDHNYSLKEVSNLTEGLISDKLLSQYEKEVKLLWNAKYVIVKKLAEIYGLEPLELFYEEEIKINMENRLGVKYINKNINRKKILENYLKEFIEKNNDKFAELFISNSELKKMLQIDKYSKTYQTNGYIVYKIINPVVENINTNLKDYTLSKSTLNDEGMKFYLNRKDEE